MIETEVHQRLRAYLRAQGHTQWPHHLTMARLVARALRVDRSALIQIDSLAAYQGSHRLSYLIPALLWPEPAVLALPSELLQTVLQQDIPNLQQGLPMIKPVRTGSQWPEDNFKGLLVTSVQDWLRSRLNQTTLFPNHIPTLIDGASDLERWARDLLSISLSGQDWETLMLAFPGHQDFIRNMRARIVHAIFQHPANPYGCHLIEEPEQSLLHELHEQLILHSANGQMPTRWQAFWQQLWQPDADRLAWSQLNRALGSVTLCSGPTDVNQKLAPIWQQQPVVVMGTALDESDKAQRYRDRLGMGDMTCLRFGPDRRNDLAQLYLPDRLPMPNTSQFKAAALHEIRTLLSAQGIPNLPTVIIIGDVPLKAQFAAVLAAEFGSRVQLEAPVNNQGILVTGWEYWRSQQSHARDGGASAPLPPGLIIITTLPIPSLENPLVAGRVAAYKQRRQDWFKAYLLPTALSELQRAIAPLRFRSSDLTTNLTTNHPETTSNLNPRVLAILDNRVNHRSYGTQILEALCPIARSSYLNEDWFPKYGETHVPPSHKLK
ncbi:MAG: ATP-dependent DNA helicase [Cyanobacteria bacterium P01_D01_bin.105]